MENEVRNIVNNGTSEYKSQVYDMLNYNTVVLEAGENINNHYYLTKHGGAIYINNFRDANGVFTGTVSGGAQIDNGVQPANIVTGWKEKNGWAFRLDNVIQPSITSVSTLLNKNEDKFRSFLDLCELLENSEILEWAGISLTAEVGPAPVEKYIIFSDKSQKALDLNVNFFNGYNYTFYAPDNDAMDIAFNEGLPTVEEVTNLYEENSADDVPEEQVVEAKATLLNMLMEIRAFIRYHFQNNSVFADNSVPRATYQSMYSSELGIPVNITSSASNGRLSVTDNSGRTIVIDANDHSKLVNKMTRDYEYDKNRENASSIAVSSFATVHQISQPLCFDASGRFDAGWRTAAARKAAARNYKQLRYKANNLKD